MATNWRDQYQRYREFYLNIQALYKQRADLRAFLEIILSLSTVLIFLLFALKPTALTIISLYNEIKEKQQTVATLDKKISDLASATKLMAANQQFIPDVNAAVSDSARPDLIVQQVQSLAAKDSVTLLGVSIGEVNVIGTNKKDSSGVGTTPLPDNANPMSVSISVKGDYSSVVQLVKDFESLRMTTKIDIVTISASDTEQGRVIVAIISGRVPFLGK